MTGGYQWRRKEEWPWCLARELSDEEDGLHFCRAADEWNSDENA